MRVPPPCVTKPKGSPPSLPLDESPVASTARCTSRLGNKRNKYKMHPQQKEKSYLRETSPVNRKVNAVSVVCVAVTIAGGGTVKTVNSLPTRVVITTGLVATLVGSCCATGVAVGSTSTSESTVLTGRTGASVARRVSSSSCCVADGILGLSLLPSGREECVSSGSTVGMGR